MQEQFSYSLLASGLGILIVFSILILLSGLMILIRKLSDSEPKKEKAVGKAKASEPPLKGVPLSVLVAVATAGTESAALAGTEWLGAAVAAYLALEEDEEVTPRAGSWSCAGSDRYDPWVSNNKFPKTVSGA